MQTPLPTTPLPTDSMSGPTGAKPPENYTNPTTKQKETPESKLITLCTIFVTYQHKPQATRITNMLCTVHSPWRGVCIRGNAAVLQVRRERRVVVSQELLQQNQVHLQHNKRPLSLLGRRLIGGRGKDVRRKSVHEGTKTPADGLQRGGRGHGIGAGEGYADVDRTRLAHGKVISPRL